MLEMKVFYKLLASLLVSFTFAIVSHNPVKACDNSSFALDSITYDGINYTIHTTLCIGGGVVGAIQGAESNTSYFLFAIFGPSTTFISFSPDTLTSDSTGCAAEGVYLTGNVAGADFEIGYAGPCNYACVTSTAGCGEPHSDCSQFSLTVDVLPDTIRLHAVEGAGALYGGCTDSSDMMIDFTTLPVVWSSFDARKQESVVEVSWSTVQEVNNHHFNIMRAGNDGNWERIGQVIPEGNADLGSSYKFIDENPLHGTNHYKIVQVDIDGQSSETEIVSLSFTLDLSLEWREVGPVPLLDYLDVAFVSNIVSPMSLQIFNLKGEKIIEQKLSASYGLNKITLDLMGIDKGIYFLRLKGSQGTINKKILKI